MSMFTLMLHIATKFTKDILQFCSLGMKLLKNLLSFNYKLDYHLEIGQPFIVQLGPNLSLGLGPKVNTKLTLKPTAVGTECQVTEYKVD